MKVLEVADLVAGYGQKVVLHGISLEAMSGEIIAIVGPNGSGKSTTLKAIFGLIKVRRGRVSFQGRPVHNRSPSLNVRAGLSYVPQGSRVFTEMTVRENLEIGGYILVDRAKVRERVQNILELFPILKERQNQPAATLSGGEKQILALGRTLILKPKLLLLDEPSLGLAPESASIAIRSIKEIREKLQTTIVLVEQKVREALSIANRVYVLELGRIALHDTSSNILKKQ